MLSYGRGDLYWAGDETWKDYMLSTDIRYDLLFPETHYGDAGVTVRTADTTAGVDSYRGYYIGLRADDQVLLLGRADYDWKLLATARMPAPLRAGIWYHLSVLAKGCTFDVSAAEGGQAPITTLHYFEPNCRKSGAIGLRSFYTQSSWRNLNLHLLR